MIVTCLKKGKYCALVDLRSLRFSMRKLVENGPNNGERKVAAGVKKMEGGRKNRREVGFVPSPFSPPVQSLNQH